MAGIHAQQVQQETTVTLIAIAIAAAAGASLIGVLLAQRIAGPLGSLGVAAAAVAGGDLDRRSGLGTRSDEIGSLGRSFDAYDRTIDSHVKNLRHKLGARPGGAQYIETARGVGYRAARP